MRCERDHKDGGVCQTPLVNGECSKPEGHVQTLPEKAADIGRIHGKRAASCVTDGNTTRERYQELLKGIEDGDPMVLDSVREPGFTGEYGDDYSEDDLLHDVGIQRMDTDTEDVDEIVNAWIDAARDAFWQEIERVCRYQLED